MSDPNKVGARVRVKPHVPPLALAGKIGYISSLTKEGNPVVRIDGHGYLYGWLELDILGVEDV